MIARRAFLAAGAAVLALPRREGASQLPEWEKRVQKIVAYAGAPEQGRLIVGSTEPGSSVTVDGNAVRVSPVGMFVFGFAFDQTQPATIRVRYPDGTAATTTIEPVIRHYEIQRINGLPQKFVTPSAEELARIHREALTIFEARKRDTAGIGFAQVFEWPFPGIVSGVYGSRRIDNGVPMAPHLGVDIAAPEGTPIHAPADAVVSISDDYFLDGGFTLLDHGHGVFTSYMHQSKLLVKPGDKVARGQVIGLVGQTGRATGPHLHWGLNWFQLKLDPSLSTPAPLPPRA